MVCTLLHHFPSLSHTTYSTLLLYYLSGLIFSLPIDPGASHSVVAQTENHNSTILHVFRHVFRRSQAWHDLLWSVVSLRPRSSTACPGAQESLWLKFCLQAFQQQHADGLCLSPQVIQSLQPRRGISDWAAHSRVSQCGRRRWSQPCGTRVIL